MGSSSDRNTGLVLGTILGIAIGVIAVALRASPSTVDIRHHEHRVQAAANEVVLALQTFLNSVQADSRERRHDVEEILSELREVRRDLNDREERGDVPAADVKRALSNVERAVIHLLHARPSSSSRTRHAGRHVHELLHELRDLKQILERLEASSASTVGEAPRPSPGEAPRTSTGEPTEPPPDGPASGTELRVPTASEPPPQDSGEALQGQASGTESASTATERQDSRPR